MKRIKLENIKGIRNLEFLIPETNDVYLLVGANGIGKSTLLTCLDRICNSYAFADNFKSSRVTNIDQYRSAAIQYDTDTVAIRYIKGNTRWVSSPRKNSHNIFSSFGFAKSIFIKADSKRIEPIQADIQRGRFEDVDPSVKLTLNQIFETVKFNHLKRLRNQNGRGRSATYFYVIQTDQDSYSEKRFSNGELAIIKLIEQIGSVPDNSLILLDEAEMALHPRVQINLLQYLKSKSQERNQLVIISTHSPTLINKTHRKKIILLDLVNSQPQVIYECYPAKAIGTIDNIENSGFDYHFFVEDIMAKRLLKKMIQLFSSIRQEHVTASINITPVGGYLETSKLAVETKTRVFANSKVYAMLDEDAFTIGLRDNPFFERLYNSNRDTIKSLGCTPENWLIDKLEGNDPALNTNIRTTYHCEIQDILGNSIYTNCRSDNIRKLCKLKFDAMVSILINHSGDSEEIVIDSFVEMVTNTLDNGRIMELLNPLFSHR